MGSELRDSVIPGLLSVCKQFYCAHVHIAPSQSYSVKLISGDYVCAPRVLILYLSAGSNILEI